MMKKTDLSAHKTIETTADGQNTSNSRALMAASFITAMLLGSHLTPRYVSRPSGLLE
jgi:hypothetical protein